jgi:nucleoside-diphosphate-sugar epimerase
MDDTEYDGPQHFQRAWWQEYAMTGRGGGFQDMTKLVIGASGFLGSHTVRELVNAGHRVRVMLRRTSSTGMFPNSLAGPHLRDGSFMRVADEHLDVPLYWQCWKLKSPVVARITEAVRSAAADRGLRRR